MRIALVCICKNEARFLPEWLSYYLTLGVTEIFAFDNDSEDGSGDLMRRLGDAYPIRVIDWPSKPQVPAQRTAYNWALANLVRDFDWVAFFDCDEFLVLHRHADIGEWLAGYGEEVGAVGVSWLTFGSSHREASDYGQVTTAFRLGGPRSWTNNLHVKTVARVGCLESMRVHVGTLRRGSLVFPNGEPIGMGPKPGIATKVEHSVAQLNHYQIKSKEDFDAKIRRGRANQPIDGPLRIRADPEKFWRGMDRNQFEYDEILPLAERASPLLAEMTRLLER